MVIDPASSSNFDRSNKELANRENDEPMNNVHRNVSLPEDNDRGLSTDPLWTVEDVAIYLKLQPETIRSMARRGELPALKIGKVWRFQRHAIHEMLVNMN